MPGEPLKLYRPDRTPNGAGGFAETLSEPTVIYGRVVVDESEITVEDVDIHEDVRVGDLIKIESLG